MNSNFRMRPLHLVTILVVTAIGLTAKPLATYGASLAFTPPVSYATGFDTQGVATGDLNGDGKIDLITANYISGTASVLLGKGDGTFAPHVDYALAAGAHPYSVAVGDFNHDGKLDLATANGYPSPTVSVLLGNGDVTFRAHTDYPVGTLPIGIVAGDFNRDGKLDLAVTHGASDGTGNSVSVLLGNGDGTFQPHVDYPVGGSAPSPYSPYGLTTADFNGDGKLDLAVVNSGYDTVSILLGNGDGTFQPHVDYAVGTHPFGVVAGDFNRDGKADLAVTNGSSNTVSVLLGNGDGTFQSHTDYGVGSEPVGLALGDLNGDGSLDLVTANAYQSSVVSVLLGNGDGTLQPKADFEAGPNVDVKVADFNLDHRLDLVVANTDQSTVSVLLNTTVSPIDITPPVITYSGNAGTYTVDQMVNITCSASDPDSGIASTTCHDIVGPAYVFNLGINTFSATATDYAGNAGTGSTSFTVRVTFASLCNLTQRFEANAGPVRLMCTLLNAAQGAAARGNATAKAADLKAYTLLVKAQSGRMLTPQQAAILTRLAAAL